MHDDQPVGLDGLQVEFDDERAVSDAGVMLVATLAKRLGIEALPANPGVNPSLTITALAEHTIAQVPAIRAAGPVP